MPTNVTLNNFIYVVLIVTTSDTNNQPGFITKSTCSGTLIREDLVLTAAHCFQDQKLIREVKIELVSGVVRNAKSIYIHPDFNQNGHDLAVLKCPSTEMKINPDLPTAEPNIYGNQSCFVSGFGGSNPKLKALKAIFLNQSSIILTENVIRTIFVGKTPCKGDSGGPLICGRTLYGVLSKGSVTSCSEKISITLFEDVFYHLTWLKPILKTPIAAAPSEFTITLICVLALFIFIIMIILIFLLYKKLL